MSYGFLCHPTEPGILEFFEGDFLRIGIPWDEYRPSNHHANRGLDLMIFGMQQTVHFNEINQCPLGSCMVYYSFLRPKRMICPRPCGMAPRKAKKRGRHEEFG